MDTFLWQSGQVQFTLIIKWVSFSNFGGTNILNRQLCLMGHPCPWSSKPRFRSPSGPWDLWGNVECLTFWHPIQDTGGGQIGFQMKVVFFVKCTPSAMGISFFFNRQRWMWTGIMRCTVHKEQTQYVRFAWSKHLAYQVELLQWKDFHISTGHLPYLSAHCPGCVPWCCC